MRGLALSVDQPLMASFSDLAGTNLTTFLAAMDMATPVCGLRPVRAGRSLTLSLPIPGSVSSSPCSRASLTMALSCSSMARAVALGTSVDSAISVSNWSLVMAMDWASLRLSERDVYPAPSGSGIQKTYCEALDLRGDG